MWSTTPGHPGQRPVEVWELMYCPVCGWGDGKAKIDPWSPCPCCYAEYGFDDTEAYQQAWCRQPVFSVEERRPPGWRAAEQFRHAIPGWSHTRRWYRIDAPSPIS